jgi:pyruvate/2-oxoglutarate dehydrogenase complex dihydrolipoamide acyltransferase (E2) component
LSFSAACSACGVLAFVALQKKTHAEIRTARRIAIVTTLRVPKTGGIPTTKVIVVKWLKRKGQKVRQGEPIVELQTDKVNYELDSPADGVLLEITAKEDSEVPVGDVLGHIGQPGEAVPKT